MLDINLFREHPELIRESQRRRFASVEVVDEIINLDKECRKMQFNLKNLRKQVNKINKQVSKLKLGGEDASKLIADSEEIKKEIAEKEVEAQETLSLLNSKLETVENLIHPDSVGVDNDEANDNYLTQGRRGNIGELDSMQEASG